MNTLFKIFIVFLLLSMGSAIMMRDFGIEFGDINYWQNHGVFFLIFITLFPRLTLLFSSVATGGLLWWLAWFITPRFLVAYLATIAYWQTNPVLVVISWVIAIGGESSEKTVVINRGSPFRSKRTVILNNSNHRHQGGNSPTDSIEAEFKVKNESDLD